MSETLSQGPDANTPKAPKDKNCPFCGQAFTASSLGRHLDLWVRGKNPKAPDGIHDVVAISKMREGITRRNPRPSLGGSRRNSSTPAGTPRQRLRKETSLDSDGYRSPAIPRDGQYAVDSSIGKYPFGPRWEATGVINEVMAGGDGTPDHNQRPAPKRNVSRQVTQKVQLDVKQKLSDAMDTARAAELALRELLSSWRAAKYDLPLPLPPSTC